MRENSEFIICWEETQELSWNVENKPIQFDQG